MKKETNTKKNGGLRSNVFWGILAPATIAVTAAAAAGCLFCAGMTARIVIAAIGVAGIVLTAVWATVFAKRTAEPIDAVSDVLNCVARGEMELDVKDIADGNVGELAAATRAMAQRMRADYEVLEEISKHLFSLGDGETWVTFTGDYSGAFYKIKQGLIYIADNLFEVTEKIKENAAQVAEGSRDIAAGAENVAVNATLQASGIEQLTDDIVTLSEHIRGNAENAMQAKDELERADDEVHASSEQMAAMTGAMDEINERAQKIGKIIETIDDIAFQTNILALNAAVEAARAGEAGKGFAVVADEVRNLAGKSAEAAKSTAALIDETIRAVEKGVSITERTEECIRTVVDTARSVTLTVEKMADASVVQAESAERVSSGVKELSGTVSQNSAVAEESAAAARELSEGAKRTQDLMQRFTRTVTTVEARDDTFIASHSAL